MGFKRWLNENVIDLEQTLLYGDIVIPFEESENSEGDFKRIEEAEIKHLIKSAFNLTYMNLENRNQGNTEATIATFFGLPTGDLNARNVLKQMAGWNDAFSPSKNLVKGLPNFILSSLGILAQTGWNTTKLVTEFVPLAIKNILNKAIYTLYQIEQQELEPIFSSITIHSSGQNTQSRSLSAENLKKNFITLGSYFLQAVGLVGLSILYVAFKILYMVGRAITSPINSMQTAFRAGYDLADFGSSIKRRTTFSVEEKERRTILGHILGGAAALLSLTITAVIYVIIFPFALKALAAVAFPAIANVATAVLSPAAIAWLSGVIASINSAFITVGTTIISAFGLAGVVEATAVGAAAVGAAVIASSIITAGTAVGGVVDTVGYNTNDQLMVYTYTGQPPVNQQKFVNVNGIPGATLYLKQSPQVIQSSNGNNQAAGINNYQLSEDSGLFEGLKGGLFQYEQRHPPSGSGASSQFEQPASSSPSSFSSSSPSFTSTFTAPTTTTTTTTMIGVTPTTQVTPTTNVNTSRWTSLQSGSATSASFGSGLPLSAFSSRGMTSSSSSSSVPQPNPLPPSDLPPTPLPSEASLSSSPAANLPTTTLPSTSARNALPSTLNLIQSKLEGSENSGESSATTSTPGNTLPITPKLTRSTSQGSVFTVKSLPIASFTSTFTAASAASDSSSANENLGGDSTIRSFVPTPTPTNTTVSNSSPPILSFMPNPRGRTQSLSVSNPNPNKLGPGSSDLWNLASSPKRKNNLPPTASSDASQLNATPGNPASLNSNVNGPGVTQ